MNAHLQRLQDAIDALTQGITVDDLARRPAEGKWSVAEILEHLSLTYSGTVKNLARTLDAGKTLGGVPTLKQRFRTMLVTDFGYIPSGRKSPEAAKPRGMPSEQILESFKSRIVEMDEVIQACENKFGKRSLVSDHPILGPFTVEQWRKFHWVHGRHHIKQIEQMRKTV